MRRILEQWAQQRREARAAGLRKAKLVADTKTRQIADDIAAKRKAPRIVTRIFH